MSRVGFPALTVAASEIEINKEEMNFITTNLANGRCLSNAQSRGQCTNAVHDAVSPLEGVWESLEIYCLHSLESIEIECVVI